MLVSSIRGAGIRAGNAAPSLPSPRHGMPKLTPMTQLMTPHYAMRNLTEEVDFSLLSLERFASLTPASDLSGSCIWGQGGAIAHEGL
jgi:hypothetical protein